MRRRDLLAGLSLVPLAAPAVAQCVLPGFPRSNRPGRCEAASVGPVPDMALDFMTPGSLDPRITFTRASTATYFDSGGVMQTAAANTPRWDYNPTTLQLRGLLVEEARTNLVTNSQNVSVWPKEADVTMLANATTSPSGNATATRITEGVLNTAYTVTNPTTVAANTLFAFSIYLKRGNCDWVRFVAGDSGSLHGANAYINLVTGATTFSPRGSGTNVSGGSVALPNGWFRMFGTFQTPATTAQFYFMSAQSDVSAARVNNAQYYAWGGQIEAGAFPTSLILTGATTVLRAAEQMSMPTSPWLVPTKGTFAIEFLLYVRSIADQTLIDLAGGTTVRQRVYGGGGWAIRSAIGAVGFNTANVIASNNLVAKTALGWEGTTGKSVLDGGPIISAAIVTDATGATTAWLGVAASTGYLNSYLRSVRYWPRLLSDAELQQITS
jgi:hypothetical protein